MVRSANIFVRKRRWLYTEHTGAEDTATQGCARSADTGAGMAGRLRSPLSTQWWLIFHNDFENDIGSYSALDDRFCELQLFRIGKSVEMLPIEVEGVFQ